MTINTIPDNFRKLHRGITVHGLLASFLAFGGPDTTRYSRWKKSWPSMQEFQDSMPILWPSFTREPLDNEGNPDCTIGLREDLAFILPPAIAGRRAHYQMREFWKNRDTAPLYRQEEKLKADWQMVSKVFPGRTLPEYTYYWLIVNTRSFYFEVSGEAARNHDDRMVLCPFIDYFNHSDHGVSFSHCCMFKKTGTELQCDVDFSEKGYTVTSDRTYGITQCLQTEKAQETRLMGSRDWRTDLHVLRVGKFKENVVPVPESCTICETRYGSKGS